MKNKIASVQGTKALILSAVMGITGLTVFAATAGLAADLPPPPLMEPLRPTLVDVGSGWYLRGDVGAAAYDDPKFKYSDSDNANVRENGRFLNESFGSTGLVGVGVGYQFNNWFRSDVTGEYRFGSHLSVRDRIPFTDGGGQQGISNNWYRGEASSLLFLVNGYVDLGTWNRITPFIGAGIGYVQHRNHGFTDQGFTYYPATDFASPTGGYLKDKNHGNMAWALHAGASYRVNNALSMEVAYRYANLGEARTGDGVCACGSSGYPGYKIKDITSHDMKIGMRWMLGTPVAAAMPEPLPLPMPVRPRITK
jgi:opacity protein-like surface antigen